MNFKNHFLGYIFLLTIIFYSFVSLFFSSGYELIDIGPIFISIIQSLFSSGFVIFFGLMGGYSLFSVQKKYRNLTLLVILLPQFLPSNFFMSSLLISANFLDIEFRGFWAVVISHVILNTGLASCILYFIFQRKVINLIDVVKIFKLSKKKFALALMKSGGVYEFFSVFVFFTLIHSLSFSIPLILTEEAVSLEQILFESLSKGKGLLIGLIIILFYFLVSRINIKSVKASDSFLSSSKKIEGGFFSKLCIGILLIPFVLCLVFLFSVTADLNLGLIKWSLFLKGFIGQFLIMFIGSILFIISILVNLSMDLKKTKIFYLFIPSVSMLLFSGFLLSSIFPEIIVIGVSSYLSFYLFINIFLSSSYFNFYSSKEVLDLYNVKDRLSLFLKTEKRSILISFALMSIWMGGDYVFSGGLSQNFVSFGSLSKKALASYQLEESQIYSILSFLSSLLFILVFYMVVYGKNFRFSNK